MSLLVNQDDKMWWLYVTVHVLSAWQVTSMSVEAKDVTSLDSTPEEPQDVPRNWSEVYSGLQPVMNEVYYCAQEDFLYKDDTPCGDGYCRCKGTVADCSKHFGNLTYIPRLPASISRLKFLFNGLSSIEDASFFRNVTQITYVDLMFNNLSYIDSGAFRSLEHLTILKLGHNNLTYDTLAPVLAIKTLQVLDLSFIQLGAPPGGIFVNYPLPRLKVLCLMGNGISTQDMAVFMPLQNLSKLDLSTNHLTRESLGSAWLPQLQILNLNGNYFNTFLDTCRFGRSLYPNLYHLQLSLNPFVWVKLPAEALCLPSLRRLDLQKIRPSPSSGVLHIPGDSFNARLFPALETLFISSMPVPMAYYQIEKNAFRNPTLNYIGLMFSGINFAAETIDPDMFAGCPKLWILFLGGNDFSEVSDEKFNRLFRQVPSLVYLRLSSAGLARINERMLRNVTNLMIMILDSNKLTEIPDGTFDSFTNLQRLDLAKNRLHTVRETTFSPSVRQRLTHVDLSGNPFLCSCELRWFRQWLTTQPALFSDCSVFYHPCYTYTCDNLPNATVQSFYVADQACLWSPGVSKYVIATVIILMFPLALVTFLYRYRWHLRLVLYEAFRGPGDRWRRLQEQHFRYDLFVSYDSDDLNWVREHLMPELEGRLGLRLCNHERDFTPGVPIVDNISDSVGSSKKVLMIFSKCFAKSPWCQFELTFCLSHVLEQDDAMVVVMLDDIPSRDLTPAMMAVMKTVTYIEWVDQPEARDSFWRRMLLALTEILPGNRPRGGNRTTMV